MHPTMINTRPVGSVDSWIYGLEALEGIVVISRLVSDRPDVSVGISSLLVALLTFATIAVVVIVFSVVSDDMVVSDNSSIM